MARRAALASALVLMLGACLGPPSLHQSVLGYDETISRLEREMLLLNIARVRNELPIHFTVTTSIAATFDYQVNAGVGASLLNPGANTYTFSLGASAAENPTLSIVPIQGEEFTRRILTPMDENKFEFLVIQGVPIDMVLRLMADGFEIQSRDGTFERFDLNSPTRPAEYEEFRRRAMHLAWLNAQRKLFVSTLTFAETLRTGLTTLPAVGDLMTAADKGYRWRRGADGRYELTRAVAGRVVITNYDPRTLSEDKRRALNERAAANPKNFILVDVDPGHPGGDYPLFGAVKLRSLNVMLSFVAAGIDKAREYDVAKDPRTGEVARNPRRALAVEVTDDAPAAGVSHAVYNGRYYAVGPTAWDRAAFTVLYQLFQMTVTDVSVTGVPITISK